ncbi:MAG: aminoglycoside phosphotransferase family protein [Thermomicrobiales bacterium]|nr:aminoglycoside phosphotransferase family protein [Thermomicrobiales bacterium]MCO5225489.1 aminoglycoside phosphotransferase family protein [Thermomicrobiales bacterium]MCO5229077.1 aminoglycoside phosphotransferase family protein [Thermomicrobiales bacterium]
MTELTPSVLLTLGTALGKRPVNWQRPECGLSATERWVVQFDDGTSVFVKAATDPATTDWLVNERHALELVGSRFGPDIIAWLEDDFPILITEDLSAGYWPAGTGETRWRDGDMAAVMDTLAQLRIVPGDDRLNRLPEPPLVWNDLLLNPVLADSGLCSSQWLARYGADILAAEQSPLGSATSLVHGDVRSDNLCLYPNGQVRFVDWSHAGIGHPYHDLVALLPTLRLEGGPRPSTILSDQVCLIVRSAGANITRALSDDCGPDWLRAVLLRLAAINLEWVSDILELAPPTGADHA